MKQRKGDNQLFFDPKFVKSVKEMTAQYLVGCDPKKHGSHGEAVCSNSSNSISRMSSAM